MISAGFNNISNTVVNITNSFVNSSVVAGANINISVQSDVIAELQRHVVFGALLDSAERFDPPKCHQETRTAVLDSIDSWARAANEGERPVMWLRGGAGAGKSAIAQTLAERWTRSNVLMASFFLSRQVAGRNENSRIIPTLAFQLLNSIPSTRPHIERAVANDLGIFQKDVLTQLQQLIIGPALMSEWSDSQPLWLFIIDGLDECSLDHPLKGHEEQQREVLEALASALSDRRLPIRILISSRPERQIRECFGHASLSALTSIITLDDSWNPDADINLFLHCRFEEIRRTHPYIESSWPSHDEILKMVQKSSGQFIYPSVVAGYLSRLRTDPRISLSTILGAHLERAPGARPFAALDAVYTMILTDIPPTSLTVVMKVFEIIIVDSLIVTSHLFVDTVRRSPAFFEKFLFLPDGQLYLHLSSLHSIITIPPEELAYEVPITFLHASFSDFLTDQRRSGSFYIEPSQAHLQLQLFRLKHTIYQALSSTDDIGYVEDGFLSELQHVLEDRSITLPLSDELAEGLSVLIGTDEQELSQYINNHGLSHLGSNRNERFANYLSSSREAQEAITNYIQMSRSNITPSLEKRRTFKEYFLAIWKPLSLTRGEPHRGCQN